MNWGLGHATRDIPIIQQLLNRDFEVIIAADGRPLELLRKEFPQLKWIRLQGYDIRYHKKRSLTIQVLLQLPQFIRSFFNERSQLKKIIAEEKIDALISDNRYGLYSEKIPCIFITHQTGIIAPKSLKWLEPTMNRLNRRFIEKFDECWVPDAEGQMNLSGDLSHKYPMPVNAHFIGPLSRFSYRETQKQYDLLIVLSGPEPQRSVLEKLLEEEVQRFPDQPLNSDFKSLLVRGISEGSNQVRTISKNFSVVDFLTSEQLNEVMLASDIIFSRPGYSTIMDLAVIGKKAILIPTPGQTEQEYLAEYFKGKGIFYSEKQEGFELSRAMNELKKYSGIHFETGTQLLEERIGKLSEL